MDERGLGLVAELACQDCKESGLPGWKEKLNALKKHKQLRDPTSNKRHFFARSQASSFVTTKL
jgi:hypothetical protein